MNDLIDTTEMYLRTILELEEENVVPLRARIAERLHQSGPTVSQTVGRMERDGLLTVEGDRHLEFTPEGRERAVAVMRKHRLAELLLVQVIGLEYENAHVEACRWEHVMSEDVERKVYELLGKPQVSPYGNRIPGLDALDADAPSPNVEPATPLVTYSTGTEVQIKRISEQLQTDPVIIQRMRANGLHPGAVVTVLHDDDETSVIVGDKTIPVSHEAANLIFAIGVPVTAAT